jgi:hypothetical protein
MCATEPSLLSTYQTNKKPITRNRTKENGKKEEKKKREHKKGRTSNVKS